MKTLKETVFGIMDDNTNKLAEDVNEVLAAGDPVEKWISDFVKSDNPKFDGKTKKERINMALGAFYAAQKKEETILCKRDRRIVELATKSSDEHIVRFFAETYLDIGSNPVLKIKDLYEDFVFDLTEAAVTIGSEGHVKCIKFWGACDIGKVYSGVWKQAAWGHQLRLDLVGLPGATQHPTIFFDKKTQQADIPKQWQLL